MVSVEYLRRNRIRPTLRDSLVGLFVGIPNLFASWFLILALSRLNTSVVFTLYSAGSVVLITLGGVLFFGEQLRRRELFAIGATLVAVVLINAVR
jgi:multidrug transporter EmrE-like cation transporter